MSHHRTTLYLFSLLMLFSCKKDRPITGYGEGTVEFRINYLQDTVGGYSKSVLPQSMTIRFRDDQVKTTIEAALGFFRLTNIADLEDYRNITYLKFIDKKFIYTGKKKENACCFGLLDNMEVEFTGQTKTIAGFRCEEAIASFPESDFESFPVYFTRDINIKNPNATGPYRLIPGFMMEFVTTMGNAKMHIIAETYRPEEIPDNEFIPPDDYLPVSKNEMESILYALMD